MRRLRASLIAVLLMGRVAGAALLGFLALVDGSLGSVLALSRAERQNASKWSSQVQLIRRFYASLAKHIVDYDTARN